VFGAVRVDSLHSVSVGPFRLSGDAFKAIARLYPEDDLFAGPLAEEAGAVTYRRELEEEMVEFCTAELLRHVPREIFFPGLSVAPAASAASAHPAAESGPES
jgi:spore photoproduct lyase